MQKTDDIEKLKKRAAGLASFIAVILAIAKLIIGAISGSMSVISSALDSLFDFVTSLINLFALKTSSQPADSDHRYGHGKAEALASLMQTMIIVIVCLYLIYSAIVKLWMNEDIIITDSIFLVMVISLVVTILLVTYQTYVLKKTNSLIIKTDRLHYLTDIGTNAAILIGLFVQKIYGLSFLDPAICLVLALYIIHHTLSAGKTAIDILMDKDVSGKYRGQIQEVLDNYDQVFGFHDLRSRISGEWTYLDFHLEMSSSLSFQESHDLGETIQNELKDRIPNIDVIIHTDPVPPLNKYLQFSK